MKPEIQEDVQNRATLLTYLTNEESSASTERQPLANTEIPHLFVPPHFSDLILHLLDKAIHSDRVGIHHPSGQIPCTSKESNFPFSF